MSRWGFIFIVVIFCSCRAGRDLTGKYLDSYGHRLELLSDSTFRYAHWSFHLYMASSGRLSKVGTGKFLLNSTIKNVTVPVKVKEVKTFDGKSHLSVSLNILNGNHLEDYSCQININGESFGIVRCDALSGIELPEIVDSVSLFFTETPQILTGNRISQHLKSLNYRPKDRFMTSLLIGATLDDRHFSYEPFINRELRVTLFGLKVFNYENKRWDFLKKVDDKTIIFWEASGR